MTTILLTPIYGYGWSTGGQLRDDVPAPFAVKLETEDLSQWIGVVVTEGHEFLGCRIAGSERHSEPTECFNVSVETEGPTTGWACLTGADE